MQPVEVVVYISSTNNRFNSLSFHKVSAAQSNFGKATINSLNILSCLFYSGYNNIPSKYLSTISWCLNLIIFEVKCKSYKVIVDGLAELCGMIWLNHIRTFMSSLKDKTPFKASLKVSGSSFIFLPFFNDILNTRAEDKINLCHILKIHYCEFRARNLDSTTSEYWHQ